MLIKSLFMEHMVAYLGLQTILNALSNEQAHSKISL